MTTTTSGTAVTTVDGSTAVLPTPALDELREAVAGQLLLADDPGWHDAVQIWNAMAASQPALVVQPTTVRQVAATVRFARRHRLLLTIKGGGHNIAGTALADGALTVDLARMRNVSVDVGRRLVDVGPGCRLGEVDRATQQHGLATVLGFISDTGVAGLTLGGGLGYLTRRFGWTVDNLEAVEVVTSEGEIRTASRHENPDLFWALRGAGANFGIVTRFTFRLHAVGPTVFGGLIGWPFEQAEQVLRVYRDLTTDAPPELTAFLMLMYAPPAPFVPPQWHGRPVCASAVCFTGDHAEVDGALAPLRALGAPVFDLLAPRPYVEVQSYLDDGEPAGQHYYWKTEFLSELDDGLLAAARAAFDGCPVPGGDIGILHLGGALNSHAEDDGAVGNRDARFAIGVKAMWDPGEPDAGLYRKWVREAWLQIRPFSTGATYINFQTADEDSDRVRATYGRNYDRLAQLKAAYDPDNTFRANRNIQPAR